jgi:acetyltransferase-like isoleucine patch superfamily enzyme
MHVCLTNDNNFGSKGYDQSFVQSAKIGDRVKIGAGATLLPNVKIGDDSVIAAGSIVTKDIPSASFALGQPAKILRAIDLT